MKEKDPILTDSGFTIVKLGTIFGGDSAYGVWYIFVRKNYIYVNFVQVEHNKNILFLIVLLSYNSA